ncbi:MAG: hypothetical protein V4712_15990 [Pseudomonadota bacterium]
MITVDHFLRVSVNPVDHNNEIYTLQCLASGISMLALQVKMIEEPIRAHELSNRKCMSTFGFGGLEKFGVNPTTAQLLTCYFHWYGLSICNYVRLVGFIKGLNEGRFSRSDASNPEKQSSVKNFCDGFFESIPEVQPIKVWRDKVFAHFSITDPRKRDNSALLEMSVMSPITYSDGSFCVGGMALTLNDQEAALPKWSVSDSYEKLTPRFWPVDPLLAVNEE